MSETPKISTETDPAATELTPVSTAPAPEESVDPKFEVVDEFFGYTKQELVDEKHEPGVNKGKEAWIEINIKALESSIQSTLRGAGVEATLDVIKRLAADDDVRYEYITSRTAAVKGSQVPSGAVELYLAKIAEIKGQKSE